jgi:hypothetical protein
MWATPHPCGAVPATAGPQQQGPQVLQAMLREHLLHHLLTSTFRLALHM